MFKIVQQIEQCWKKDLILNKTLSYKSNKIDRIITYFILLKL